MRRKGQMIMELKREVLRNITMSVKAILVKASRPYHVYHMSILNDYYRQQWVVCKRYSDIYKMRKMMVRSLALSLKMHTCEDCSELYHQIKYYHFPSRYPFNHSIRFIEKRALGLEDFLKALCEFLTKHYDVIEMDEGRRNCRYFAGIQISVKRYLQFPIEYEMQHIRSIRSLKYVDEDSCMGETSCPICLIDWKDNNRFSTVLPLVQSSCGHVFHEQCINEWYRNRFDCPMCRSVAGTTTNILSRKSLY